MPDDFGPLLDEIRRVLPESRLFALSDVQLAAIKNQYPDVPDHYLAFLRNVGHGALGDGYFAVYSGLCKPRDFFDKKTAEGLDGILFFGDDFAGWMLGFETRGNWRMVGVDSGWPKPHPQGARTVAEFVEELLARERQSQNGNRHRKD